jgi:multiple sugar transport system substrate-binding protein
MRRPVVITTVFVISLIVIGQLISCSPQVIKETVVVEREVPVEKEVEKIVKETVVVEVEKEAVADPKDEIVTLRFATFGDQPSFDTWDVIIKLYEEQNPRVKVIQEPMPWTNLTEKMIANAMGANAADVTRVQMSNASRFHVMGMFLPLDDFINGPNGIDLDIYFESGLQAFRWNGVQFAFPQSSYVTAMYYNVDLFEEAGVPLPTEDWTWDELKEAAQKLTKTDSRGDIVQYGWVPPSWNWAAWIYASGGWFYDPMMERVLFDSPEALEAAKLAKEIVHELETNPPMGLYQTLGGPWQLFQQGRSAMLSHVGDSVAVYTRDTPELNFATSWLPPRERGKFGTFHTEDGYAIWSGTKHPQESWDFVKFLISPEIQALWYETLMTHMPNNQTSWDMLGDRYMNDPKAAGFLNMIPYGHSEAWQNPNGHEVYFNIFEREAVQGLWADEGEALDPVEFWVELAERANKSQADFWRMNPAYKPELPVR